MLPTSAGVEPATSWSPVGRASNWATEAGLFTQTLVIILDKNGDMNWASTSENVPSDMLVRRRFDQNLHWTHFGQLRQVRLREYTYVKRYVFQRGYSFCFIRKFGRSRHYKYRYLRQPMKFENDWCHRPCLSLQDMAPDITKTCLYNFDPLKPHFYTVKLGFTGVYIIFLFLLKNIDCGYSLEPPRRGGSNEVSTIYVLRRNMKNFKDFYLKALSFWR